MKFTHLDCDGYKERHPTLCLFNENKNVVYCTALGKCGLRLKKKGRK
jgi:hypothetical protein